MKRFMKSSARRFLPDIKTYILTAARVLQRATTSSTNQRAIKTIAWA
jgi:hypothetical protein